MLAPLADIFGFECKSIDIEAYVDNWSVIEAIFSTKLVEDKRLRIDIAAIKELLQLQVVNRIKWVPGHL